MSTHASVGVQTDGTTRWIYVHSDGYYDHLGKALIEAFNSRERAEALVALGNLSCVDRAGSLEWDPAGGRFGFGDGTRATHRDDGRPWEDERPMVERGDLSQMRGYEYSYLWLDASDDGPEGWYAKAPGGWSPMGAVRVA